MNTPKTKEKFTAVLTHAADKKRIVEIREASGLSEKDTMTAILDRAWAFKDQIVEGAKKTVEAKNAARQTLRKEKYEAYKADLKAVREARKAKQAASDGVQVTPEPTKTLGAADAPHAKKGVKPV